MQVTINDTTIDIPYELSSIPLSKYVEYYNEYGRELDKQFAELFEKKYDGDVEDIELLKQIDIDSHIDNEALAWYSFWSGYNLFEVKEMPFIQPVLDQYRLFRFLLKESMEEVKELPLLINCNNEQWMVQDFKVNPSSEMSFNEIITSKEIMRQMHKMSKGHWDGLPYLCAIFFRKKDELFSDELILEGGERLELLKQLPLNYALQVAFFLTICVSSWSNTLVSSMEKEVEILSQN